MSKKLTQYVWWGCREIKGSELVVLFLIAFLIEEKDGNPPYVDISHSELARMAHVSVDQIWRTISSLQKSGRLIVIGRGKQKKNRYHIPMINVVQGYTNLPGGFQRWVCPACQQENAGSEDNEYRQWTQETCQQCGLFFTIAGYDEPRWGVRSENIA
jgi:hypothetical protein